MGRTTTRLTDRQLQVAKPKEKDYVLSDGDGLQLRIRANGSRLWNISYQHPSTKKRVNMGLGTYPEISLALARKLTIEARELLAQGIDLKAHRDQSNLQKKAIHGNSFEKVAKEWLALKEHSITPGHAEDIWRSLERYILPKLGNTPVAQITAPVVIGILKPIEAKGNLETVKRLTQRLNEVMTYAVNGGMVLANPLSGIKANFRKPKKEHLATLKPQELPDLMVAIANASIRRVTRALIEWQLHTMTRPSEAAGTRWDEIDFDTKIWIIPASRMKRGRDHTVPLTEQSLAILEAMKPISSHREFVFPSDKEPRTHCNSQTANMALKRMGFGGRLVSHGLRSLASTTLNEEGFDAELIEVSLSHVDKNQVRNAYNRTDYLERRRPLMAWWSNRIEEASKGSLSVAGFKGFKVLSGS
ncbi:MAG: integrase domain-containing protein [Porticoccaceae bacterium]